MTTLDAFSMPHKTDMPYQLPAYEQPPKVMKQNAWQMVGPYKNGRVDL